MKQIKDNSLFRGLNEEQIGYILPAVNIRKFRSSEVIIEENSVGNSVNLLISGKISIEKNLIPIFEGYQNNPDDKKVIEVDDSMDYYFGEMSLFDSALKRSASIYALSDVEVAEITDTDLNRIITERPDIGIILLRNIGLKLSILLDKSNVELSKMITAFTLALKL